MTNERAVEILKAYCYINDPMDIEKSILINQALDKAVNALEEHQAIKEILDTTVDRIMELYGALIVEGYEDIYDEIKREVEKNETVLGSTKRKRGTLDN